MMTAFRLRRSLDFPCRGCHLRWKSRPNFRPSATRRLSSLRRPRSPTRTLQLTPNRLSLAHAMPCSNVAIGTTDTGPKSPPDTGMVRDGNTVSDHSFYSCGPYRARTDDIHGV